MAPTHPAADPAEPRAWEVVSGTGGVLHVIHGVNAEHRARSMAGLFDGATAVPLYRRPAGEPPGEPQDFSVLAKDVTGWCAGAVYQQRPGEPFTVRLQDDHEFFPGSVIAEAKFDSFAPFLVRLLNAAPALVAEVERLRAALTPPAPKTEET